MVYLILTISCSAAMAIVLKIFHRQTGNRYGILLGNYLTCILIALAMLPEKGLVFAPSPATVLCGLIDGFFFVSALVVMQTSIRANGAILPTAHALSLWSWQSALPFLENGLQEGSMPESP